MHVLGFVLSYPNLGETRNSLNFSRCSLFFWITSNGNKLSDSPELQCPRRKRLTLHLTQIAAWTGASLPPTHSNAITAFWSSAQGAGDCRRSRGTKPLPLGRPHESRIYREGRGPRAAWARGARSSKPSRAGRVGCATPGPEGGARGPRQPSSLARKRNRRCRSSEHTRAPPRAAPFSCPPPRVTGRGANFPKLGRGKS